MDSISRDTSRKSGNTISQGTDEIAVDSLQTACWTEEQTPAWRAALGSHPAPVLFLPWRIAFEEKKTANASLVFPRSNGKPQADFAGKQPGQPSNFLNRDVRLSELHVEFKRQATGRHY